MTCEKKMHVFFLDSDTLALSSDLISNVSFYTLEEMKIPRSFASTLAFIAFKSSGIIWKPCKDYL